MTPKTLYPEEVTQLLEVLSAANELLTLRHMELRRNGLDPVSFGDWQKAYDDLRDSITEALPTIHKLLDTPLNPQTP